MKDRHTNGGASIRRRPFKLTRLAVTAPCAGVLALALGAAIAVGAIPDSGGVIHGCYQKRSGRLRVIDPATGQLCTRHESELSWNQRGPQGNPGPQ
jgi:hypothetical protein